MDYACIMRKTRGFFEIFGRGLSILVQIRGIFVVWLRSTVFQAFAAWCSTRENTRKNHVQIQEINTVRCDTDRGRVVFGQYPTRALRYFGHQCFCFRAYAKGGIVVKRWDFLVVRGWRSALVAVACSSSVVLADMEVAPRGLANNTEARAGKRWAPTGEARGEGEQVGERLIDRLLANAKLTAEIGLTEDTVARLREESHALQARQIDLDAQIRKLSLDQTDRMSKLLLSPDASTNELMKTVEQIGQLRIEQAKLAVQHLIIVRRYLTPDQIRKARELMRERLGRKDAEARPEARAEKVEARNAVKKDKPQAPAGPPPPKPPEGW
jgi:hypothetical protein